MSAQMDTTRGRLITSDGTVLEAAIHVEATPGSDNLLWIKCFINGVEVGTPVRLKASGNRFAADFPGVDGASFITDSGGHITNG